MRRKQQRAAQLWRDLILLRTSNRRTSRRPQPLEVGFIMHEFAVGLIAVGSEKEVIMTFLANRIGDIGCEVGAAA